MLCGAVELLDTCTKAPCSGVETAALGVSRELGSSGPGMAWRSLGFHRPCQESQSQALAWEGAPWLRALGSQQDRYKPRAFSPAAGRVGGDRCNTSAWHVWVCRDR